MTPDEILQKFAFYRAADAPLRELIRQTATPARLPAGTSYFREGQICTHLGLVGWGSLRVFRSAPTGREITLYHVRPGESCLVNITCLLTGTPSPASACAETAIEALLVPAGAVRRWIATSEEIHQYIFGMIASRLGRMMALVEEVAFSRMDKRLADCLLERFANQDRPSAGIATTHERLAAELGSAREVVSRLLKEFERRGAIRLGRGRIELREIDRLRAIANLEPDPE